MFFPACANESPWIKIIQITIIIVLALITSPWFAREAFGSVKRAMLCPKIQRG